jgi:Response regulator containing a CheY-like receiver domain and an HTH DNA-binding domain
MNLNKTTIRDLWAQQQISNTDIDYDLWNKKRESLEEMSRITQSCLFTVDVFKERYDFASESFVQLFGYNAAQIKTIRKQGDVLEERFHPDDRDRLTDFQIEHGRFIYSLPPECRNDYQQLFRFRILNNKRQYINVVSRHQVIQQTKSGKAWMVMGIMNISPDRTFHEKVDRLVINRKTGEILTSTTQPKEQLTEREKEILALVRQGLLSKEIAGLLNLSIHTVNNHRKNILAKLKVNNFMEAVNIVHGFNPLS